MEGAGFIYFLFIIVTIAYLYERHLRMKYMNILHDVLTRLSYNKSVEYKKTLKHLESNLDETYKKDLEFLERSDKNESTN